MKKLALIFCNPVRYGGHVTYTAHLYNGLKSLGVDVAMYVPRHRTENVCRKFGYGLTYTNMTTDDIIDTGRKILIVAPSKPMSNHIDALLARRARIVIHDPAEFKHGWDVVRAVKNKPIVIRKSMLAHIDTAKFIVHPYDRLYTDDDCNGKGSNVGISISRIDFDKHTELLLDANRLLRKRDKIDIRGFENRIYTRFNILPKYPEWKQSIAAYPRELRAAAQMCRDHTFMFDMSVIKKDGGGTQYTFLEAMDAGSVCVLNKEWLLKGHVMQDGVNCLAASSGKEIADLIKRYRKGGSTIMNTIEDIRVNGFELLKKHDAKKVARQYIKELNL